MDGVLAMFFEQISHVPSHLTLLTLGLRAIGNVYWPTITAIDSYSRLQVGSSSYSQLDSRIAI